MFCSQCCGLATARRYLGEAMRPILMWMDEDLDVDGGVAGALFWLHVQRFLSYAYFLYGRRVLGLALVVILIPRLCGFAVGSVLHQHIQRAGLLMPARPYLSCSPNSIAQSQNSKAQS